MSNMKVCPLCKKDNTEDSSICVYCGFDLNPTFLADSDGIPDWLSTFREETSDNEIISKETISNQVVDESLNENEPDWLSRIRERKISDEEVKPIFEDTEFDFRDFALSKGTDELVGALRSNDEQLNSEEKETDEIITNLRKSEEDNKLVQSENDYLENTTDNLIENKTESLDDDWISRLKSSPFTQESDLPAEKSNETNSEPFPDWLPVSHTDIIENEPVVEISKQEFPEWISKFRTDQDIVLDSSDIDDENKLPDWIQQETFSGDDETESAENQSEEYKFEAGIISKNNAKLEEMVIPSWISDTDTTVSEIEVDSISENQNLNEEALLEGSFDNLEKEFELIHPSIDQPPFREDLSFLDREKNPELNINGNDSDSLDLSSTSPFQLDQIPEWLDKGDEEYISTNFFEDIQTEIDKSTESGQEIQPGELPTWLKAMRPLEAVAPIISRTKENRQIEKFGPLAGLQGVLSSHQFNQLSAPPPIQSISVDISEKQKKQIEILDKLFSLEDEPIAKDKPRINPIEKIIQYVIPFALIVCIIYSFYFSSTNLNKPTIYPSETVRFATIVNGLLLNQTSPPKILTIVESDGASYAELSIITKSLLERLMLKNSHLSIISTNPNGPLLATKLIQDIASQSNNYDINNLANFGYLPGGQNGVQSFIQSPTDTISLDTKNENIWEKPALTDISTFSHFDAVLIITDNSESAKTWIEQIHALKPGTTTLVAATVQAIPLLKPYVDSNQIDGMVGGLYGSYSYSDLIQSDSSAHEKYWLMQKAGIFAFISIFILGGIWQAIAVFSRRKSKNNQGSN